MNHVQRINDFGRLLERRKGEQSHLMQELERNKDNLRAHKRSQKLNEMALEVVKQVGLKTQKQLEYHLAEQVSLALEAVFDDPYNLKVIFEEKRGKTEARICFTRRGLEISPLGACGGGAIDVASLALRLAYWSMRRDRVTRPVLLLDEPFSRLKGQDANQRALALLQEVSQQLGIQIITISDERIPREDIIAGADKVFLVSQKKGRSEVNVI